MVWCTKYRKKALKTGVDIVVKETIKKVCFNYKWIIHALEVMPDHIHLFLQSHHTDSPVTIVRTLKSLTAIAVFYSFPTLKKTMFLGKSLWSPSTYYGTVGNISQKTVQNYIESQKEKEKY